MSGIFGLLHRDGAPVDPRHLRLMQQAMASWGPDGSHMWSDGPLGLGQMRLYNTPESLYERVPRQDPSSGLVITAEARLDNRDELCERLAVSTSEQGHVSDSQLILKAYLKWGEDCPAHLLGDWSFAVWHPGARRLFVARDPFGNTALHYVLTHRFFAFASSKRALLVLPDVPCQLNEIRLVQTLARWPGDLEQTVHQGVLRLLSGHTLSVTPKQSEKRCYWQVEPPPPLHLKSLDDYADGLVDVLNQAVRSRLRSHRPIGMALSGGLDSSSVATLAAKQLRGHGQTLHAFSAVPSHDVSSPMPGRMADESPLVEAISSAAGNLDVQYLTSASISPVRALERLLALHAEPGFAVGNAYWNLDLRETAQARGMGTLLTGAVGNLTISRTGAVASPSWMTCLRRGDWKRVLYHKLCRPLRLHRLVRAYKRQRFGREPWLAYSSVAPDFARRMRLGEQMAATGYDPTYGHLYARDPRQQLCALLRTSIDMQGTFVSELGATYGLEERDPTQDMRVLTYCLAVPDHVYGGPDGGGRYLIRRAMHGHLPDCVLSNPHRGLQAADVVQRLLTHRCDVEAVLTKMDACSDVEPYIDRRRLRRFWTSLSSPVISRPQQHTDALLLLRGLSCGLLIMKFMEGES